MPSAEENASATPGTTTQPPASAPVGGSTVGSRTAERQYEFKPQENKIIGELAGKMHFVGLFLLAIGLLVIAIGVVPMDHRVVFHVGPIISGALTALVGLWTQRASVSLKSVVYTEGNDISHLISALEDLRKLYSLQFWLLILALVLACLGLWAVFAGYIDIVG
jgi:hypothetical protein